MPKYIFTHDERDNSFPERYRVVSAGDDVEFLRQSEDLTGTVLDTEAIEFIEKLMARVQSNPSVIPELVDAPFWKFVEARFRPAEVKDAENAAPANPVDIRKPS